MPTGCHSTLTETNYWRTIASLVLQVVDAILNKGQSWHSWIKNHKPHFFILISSVENILVFSIWKLTRNINWFFEVFSHSICPSLIFTVRTVSVSIFLLNKRWRLEKYLRIFLKIPIYLEFWNVTQISYCFEIHIM